MKIRIGINLKETLIKLEFWNYNYKLSLKTERYKEKDAIRGLQCFLFILHKW